MNNQANKVEELVVVMPLDEVYAPADEETGDVLDSVRHWQMQDDSDRDSHVVQLLYEAQRCWDNLAEWRKQRERARDFVYTNQYREMIKVDGEWMTEENYIRSMGREPLTNNLERRLINNVVGTYINQDKEPTCSTRDKAEQVYGQTMSTLLQYNRGLNKLDKKFAKAFEEWLWSGMVAMKVTFGWRGKKLDCWVDDVDMNSFFCDADSKDDSSFRMMGQCHEMSFQEICAQFVHGTSDADIRRQVAALKKEYGKCTNESFLNQNYSRFGYHDLKEYDFLLPNNTEKCKVIEIWNKESRKVFRFWDKGLGKTFFCYTQEEIQANVVNVNMARVMKAKEAGMFDQMADDEQMDPESMTMQDWAKKIGLIEPLDGGIEEYWYCRFVTPTGRVLWEGECPYNHAQAPYVVCAGAFIDGEIHSFESTFHDQQKYVNRLITLQDWIMKSSAKGVLLAPEGAFDGQDIDEIADAWGRFDGVIMYKPKAGVPIPQQVSANSTNVGIHELLATQLKLFEDISGVNGALQGKGGYSATSGVLYAQQTQNSTTSLMPSLMYFSQFSVDVAMLEVKTMQQFYDEDRVMDIVGDEAVKLDPAKCLNIEYDINIVESTTTPAYRQIANQFLLQLRQLGDIDGETMLEAGDFPYSDKVLQLMQAKKQQMAEAQQQMQGGMPIQQG